MDINITDYFLAEPEVFRQSAKLYEPSNAEVVKHLIVSNEMYKLNLLLLKMFSLNLLETTLLKLLFSHRHRLLHVVV